MRALIHKKLFFLIAKQQWGWWQNIVICGGPTTACNTGDTDYCTVCIVVELKRKSNPHREHCHIFDVFLGNPSLGFTLTLHRQLTVAESWRRSNSLSYVGFRSPIGNKNQLQCEKLHREPLRFFIFNALIVYCALSATKTWPTLDMVPERIMCGHRWSTSCIDTV